MLRFIIYDIDFKQNRLRFYILDLSVTRKIYLIFPIWLPIALEGIPDEPHVPKVAEYPKGEH